MATMSLSEIARYLTHPESESGDSDKVTGMPSYELVSFRTELKTVLERNAAELFHDVNLGPDSSGTLHLAPFICGMRKGTSSEQIEFPPFDFEQLDNFYISDEFRQIAKRHKRFIRLPIGPTAALHICNRMEENNLGTTKINAAGEVEFENGIILSNVSMVSDPLQMLSVITIANDLHAKNLWMFKEQVVDTCETLQSRVAEELAMNFTYGLYSLVVGRNMKRIIYCGNYERSFLCDFYVSFDIARKHLSDLPGVRMVCELTKFEKSKLAEICNVQCACRIEFDSFDSYESALHNWAPLFSFKKFPLKNNPLLPTNAKQLCMLLKWFTWPSKRQALIVLHTEDLVRCIHVLENHDFVVFDITSRCHHGDDKSNSEGKIVIKAKSSDLFYRMWHYDGDLKDVMHKILYRNNIQYKEISLLRKRKQDVERDREKIVAEVNSRIIRSAFNCAGKIWSRKTVVTSKEIDEISRNHRFLPWNVVWKDYNENDTEAVMEVRFDDENFGRAVLDYMLPLSPDTGFFNLFKHDRVGVRICPFYSIFIPAPINILKACAPDLSACMLHTDDTETDGSSGSDDKFGSNNSVARIRLDSVTDGLTVELWPERIIHDALSSLNTILEGRTVDCSYEPYSMLLFGRGLQWLLSLANQSQPYVVLTVNRLRARLTLYGSAENISTFIKTLQFFCCQTEEYTIKDTISLGQPRFLSYMTKVVSQVIGINRLCAMFGEITFSEPDRTIVFRGSLKKLNELQVFLDDVNEKIFMSGGSDADHRFSDYSVGHPICPVCQCRVQISSFCLDACGHYYCLECLCEQINNEAQARLLPWRCLNYNCGEEILMSDIKELICLGGTTPFWFTQRDMRHWLNPLRDWVIRGDFESGYFSCDTPDCEGLFMKIPGASVSFEDDQKVNQPTALCTDCGAARCLNCLQLAHNEVSCWQNSNIRNDVDVSIAHFMEQNENARTCPNTNCGAIILKEAGCNHVSCPSCKTQFCWTCFETFDTTMSVYGHLQAVHGGYGGGWVIENGIIVARPEEEEDDDDDEDF